MKWYVCTYFENHAKLLEEHDNYCMKRAIIIKNYTSQVEVSEEYYAYDFTSFLGDMGGYIGLLLGWSILSIIESCGGGLKEYMIKLWNKR